MKRTQTERVLRQLRQNRTHGVNTTDFHAPTCDGGKPILRLAARIRDLQDQGFAIRSQRKSDGTATYFLTRERELLPEPAPPRPEPKPELAREALSAALFDASGYEHQPRGAYDRDAA